MHLLGQQGEMIQQLAASPLPPAPQTSVFANSTQDQERFKAPLGLPLWDNFLQE